MHPGVTDWESDRRLFRNVTAEIRQALILANPYPILRIHCPDPWVFAAAAASDGDWPRPPLMGVGRCVPH